MARLPRYNVAGVCQHVIHRGRNRRAIFTSESDYRFYRDWLQEAAALHGLRIHAYVLMTNHVHLLATPKRKDSVSKTLQTLGRRYVHYFNATHRHTGTLWEGRYRATVVEAGRYLLTCSRYIELNPVRARLVKSPAQYRYSSYRHNAQGRPDALLTEHGIYRRLGRTLAKRGAAYRSLFRNTLERATLNEIRAATNTGWALGGDGFRGKVQKRARRRATPLPRGRPLGARRKRKRRIKKRA